MVGRVRGLRSSALLPGTVLLSTLLLGGCLAEPDPSPTPTGAAPSPSETENVAAPEILPFPTGPSESTTALPQDCRDVVPESILTELEGIPLNAPGMGGGLRPDSTRVCVWADPGATVTRLITVIGYSPYRAASDALYELGRSGYTCYEPRGGVRCELTWQHETLPVTEGRTLFYRDGVIIDTQYANLAPDGYTNAVINALWPGE